MNYNTAQIRRLAHNIRDASGTVRGLTGGDLRAARSGISASLRGKTADALTGKLGELTDDIVHLANALDHIASDLFAFARRLDEADRQAQQTIDQR